MDFSDYLPFVHMSVLFLVLLPALLLDAALGDPPGWPHPVRLLGALCLRAEALTRRGIGHEGLAGLVAVALVLGCTALGLGLLLSLPGIVALPLAIYLGFSGLALGQLLREGQAAKALLEQGEVAAARAAIAMLVSRDLTQADEADLCRALGETLAENFNDAFVAPLFWFVLAGPLGLWLYKAASTMDSMWGYPYPPWTRFGTAAARLDDALAYVPARLSALLLYLARKRNAMFWPGLPAVAREAMAMKSPNAGWPMAACAWLCGASMGGPTLYAGELVHKPALGPQGRPWNLAALGSLLKLLARAGFLAALLAMAILVLVHIFPG